MKLSVQGLNSYYGPAHILFDIALDVGAGEVVALLGRNGAGKSTTFRSIVGLVAQRSGRIEFEGRDVSNSPTHEIVRGGLGYVPEERRIFTDLTVEENLEVGRQPKRTNAPYWTREKLFALFPNLGEMRHRPGGRMSGGEQQMLTIARTLMGNPALLLLDEPSEGLARRSPLVEAVARRRLAEAGLGIDVASCGTGGWHAGEQADPRMRAAAARAGHDLESHRARQLRADDIERYDLLLAMDGNNLRDMRRVFGGRADDRLALFLAWSGCVPPRDFPDPYYGELPAFTESVDLAERGVQGLIARLRAG
jgi:branched-chain amino acid transport system ATP-binding protein